MSQEFSLTCLEGLYSQKLLCSCLRTWIQRHDTPFLWTETFNITELFVMRVFQTMWMMFDRSSMYTGKMGLRMSKGCFNQIDSLQLAAQIESSTFYHICKHICPQAGIKGFICLLVLWQNRDLYDLCIMVVDNNLRCSLNFPPSPFSQLESCPTTSSRPIVGWRHGAVVLTIGF